MKKINLLSFLLLVACSSSVSSAENVQPLAVVHATARVDNPLVVKVEMLYELRVAKISFNDVSAGTGKLQVLNASGQVIYQSDEIDLNTEPYFYAIECDKLEVGECTFIVTTKTGVYKAVVKI